MEGTLLRYATASAPPIGTSERARDGGPLLFHPGLRGCHIVQQAPAGKRIRSPRLP
jgi:hypothetical protein